MTKKIILSSCLFYTSLFSQEITSSDIDPSQGGIVLGTLGTYKKAKEYSKEFDFDVYIKKTTSKNKTYYVLFALNIPKDNINQALTQIQKKAPTAYITSNKRVKELSNDRITTQEIQDSVDRNKKALTIDNVKTKKEALELAKELKKFDVLIKAPLIKGNNYFVYVVNIDEKSFEDTKNEITFKYPQSYETSQTRINFFEKRENDDDFFIHSSKNNIKEDDVSEILALLNQSSFSKKDIYQSELLKGISLFNKNRLNEALDIFEKYADKYTDDVKLNFYIARAYFKLKRFEEASIYFERIVISNENHLRARLELAQTYLQLELYSEALTNFNFVLQSASVPANVAKNIQNRIDFIKAKKTRHFFNGLVTLSSTYDNNANSVTDEKTFDTVTLSGLKVTDEKYSDMYHSISLLGNYRYKSSDNLVFGLKGSYLHQEYSKDDKRISSETQTGIAKESKKELDLISAGTYFNLSSKKTNMTVGMDVSKIQEAGEDYSQSIGISLTYQTKQFLKNSNLIMLKYFKKEYLTTDENGQKDKENLDSNNIQVILGSYIPTMEYGSFNYMYYSLYEKRVKPLAYGATRETSNKFTNGLILGNNYPITKSFSLASSLMYMKKDNDTKEPDFGKKRKDTESTYALEGVYKINKSLSTSLAVKYITNDSNIKIYSYDKQTATLSFKYFF